MTVAVFLADDHAVVRDGLRYLLEAQPDIKVVGDAADGRQALQLVERLRPDVAIMDIAMPELNGIEATRIIRIDCPSTQVIILSIYSTEEHVSRALQAGALGYVLKESAGIEVVNAVRAVHSGHHYLSQKLSDQLIDDYLHQINSIGEKALWIASAHAKKKSYSWSWKVNRALRLQLLSLCQLKPLRHTAAAFSINWTSTISLAWSSSPSNMD